MDSRNGLVRSLHAKFCVWGASACRPVALEEPYKGGPSPLLRNVGIEIQQRLAQMSGIFLLVCGIEYMILEIAYKGPEKDNLDAGIENKYKCVENANMSFLVNILSMIVNFGAYS